jgi:hypothetical protein
MENIPLFEAAVKNWLAALAPSESQLLVAPFGEDAAVPNFTPVILETRADPASKKAL